VKLFINDFQFSNWSCYQNNENNFTSISKLTVNDITSDIYNYAQADVNLDIGNLIFAYAKINQQFKIMVSELTNIGDYQEIVSNECGYSKKNGRSRTCIVVYNPARAMLSCNSIRN
jgi:hypothetical protein